ncbi:MAG: VWA domain-containing protein [Verrucomicrobia bacterium]|nr:VWA domain-containing protein [Verrucomicrobiota bacterium]
MSLTPREQKLRWRLILGSEAEGACGGVGGADQRRDAALEYLYGREGAGRNRRSTSSSGGKPGSLDPSQLTVPDWINAVHELFPRRTIERIEKDALERYGVDELVTNVGLLQRAEPSLTLLKAILHTKHLMNAEVLAVARQLVRRVVAALLEKLARPLRSPFFGARQRRRSSLRVAKNFDARGTIRRNLQHYDPQTRRLYIRTPEFFSRVRRQTDRWQFIVLVDESGSMVDSVIHSAVTAAIFCGLQAVRTHLVLFDTSIVDVSADCADPVETIMKVQLGGGTDIGQAVRYAESLIEQPRKSIVVLISDFYEGAPPDLLLAACQRLVQQGTQLLCLAALDGQANPSYDVEMARRLAALGASVGAMTPGELALWVAEKVR